MTRIVCAPTGTQLNYKGWLQEAAYRMLQNNLDPEAAARLERVLTVDPGMGVARHVDAGYERAIEVAKGRGVKIPMMNQ